MKGSYGKRRYYLIFKVLSRDIFELENFIFIFFVGEYFGYVLFNFLVVRILCFKGLVVVSTVGGG